MLKDVIKVKALPDYHFQLTFEDGVMGIVNVSETIEFKGVFAPLREQDYFNQVRVNSDIGTICWPNEADLDPDVLYALVSGEPIPEFNIAAIIQ